MNEKFKTLFQQLVDVVAVPVAGQTPESLCLNLFLGQIDHMKDLHAAQRQKAEERIGEIGCFISKSPALYNAFADKVQSELGIKPKQLQQLIQRAKKKMRDEGAKIKNEPRANADMEPRDNSASMKLKAELFQISQQMMAPNEKNRRTAAAVLEYLSSRGRLFFNTDIRDFPNCMFFSNDRKILLAIEGDEFQSQLALETGINRSTSLFSFVFSAILDEALSGSTTTGIVPEHYWAAREGKVYISNGDGCIVKIIPNEVSQEENGVDNILFAAGCTLAPWRLTEPADPFEKCRIFREMSFSGRYGKDLLRVWTLSLPTVQETKPPLVVSGPVGGGKSKAVCGIFELYGLFPRINKAQEDGEKDFWTSIDDGGLYCLDNADTKFKWLPDALAAAATNGRSEKRQLYTDSKIVRQKANAWVAVTSANPTFASDAGLADRLIVVRLNRRDDTASSDLSRELLSYRDAGLSWVAETLSRTLADNAPVVGGLNKRHPDFAAFAVRLGRAMGREKEVIAALKHAETDKSLFNVENDIIGMAIIALIRDNGIFTGSANDLLTAFKGIDPSFNNFKWSSRGIAKHLSDMWPHLATVFKAEKKTTHGGGFQYSFSSHGDSGDCDIGFSYKPHKDSLRGDLAKVPFSVTTVTNGIPATSVSDSDVTPISKPQPTREIVI